MPFQSYRCALINTHKVKNVRFWPHSLRCSSLDAISIALKSRSKPTHPIDILLYCCCLLLTPPHSRTNRLSFLVINIITPVPIPIYVRTYSCLLILFATINIPVNVNKWEIWLFVVRSPVVNISFLSLEKHFVDGQFSISHFEVVTIHGQNFPIGKLKVTVSQMILDWNHNSSTQSLI